MNTYRRLMWVFGLACVVLVVFIVLQSLATHLLVTQQHNHQLLHALYLWQLIALGVIGVMGLRPLLAQVNADAESRQELIANLQLTKAELETSLQRAEQAARSKSDFLANMSHELRTPMNGVIGMAHLLADTDLLPEQKQYVDTITSSAEALLILLNDILDFSKIEAGALQLERIPFSINDVLHETVNLMQHGARKKNLSLVLEAPTDLPEYLWGDAGRLRQILTNLIGNAIKFTRAGYVQVKVQREGEMLHLSVTDTGIGIPPESLPTIFDKFTQADESVTRKFGGTGLGLAICKQLVLLMRGQIGVDSAVDKGSTFWFRLPCQPATLDDLQLVSQADSGTVNLWLQNVPAAEAKVLLVEDFEVNRVFADKLLRKFGFQHIETAENGREAVEKYEAKSYDIVLMDCQMPELDGYQATQQIRALEKARAQHTPIIAMTANAMVGDREKCLKAGMDDYVSKPLRPDWLQRILQMWTDLGAAAPAPAQTSASIKHQAQPVDMAQLDLFTGGDVTEEKALADLFMQQAAATIAVLEAAVAQNDNASWQAAAHRFKGAAANLGAGALSHLCKRAEQGAEDATFDYAASLLAIKNEYSRVEGFFAMRAQVVPA